MLINRIIDAIFYLSLTFLFSRNSLKFFDTLSNAFKTKSAKFVPNTTSRKMNTVGSIFLFSMRLILSLSTNCFYTANECIINRDKRFRKLAQCHECRESEHKIFSRGKEGGNLNEKIHLRHHHHMLSSQIFNKYSIIPPYYCFHLRIVLLRV